MKKIVLVLFVCLLLVGCGKSSYLSKIEEASSFDDILALNNPNEGIQPKNAKEKKALEDKVLKYAKERLGAYFIRPLFTPFAELIQEGDVLGMESGLDPIALWSKNEREIYVMYLSDEVREIMVGEIEDYQKLPNFESYKYEVVSTEVNYKDEQIIIIFEGKKGEISITFEEDSNYLILAGKIENERESLSLVKEYYFETKPALEKTEEMKKQVEEKINQITEEKKALANSIPKIGMDAETVRKTKWGEPDDINKDTYSWGTTEQWVYDYYGYVYFKDGIVTSVSER